MPSLTNSAPLHKNYGQIDTDGEAGDSDQTANGNGPEAVTSGAIKKYRFAVNSSFSLYSNN